MRKRVALTRFPLDIARAKTVLEEAGVRASTGDPETAFGYRDGAGRPRRIVARYPDGWRADLRFHVDGTFSLTQSLRLRAIAVKPGMTDGESPNV